jgi:polygalacturonase
MKRIFSFLVMALAIMPLCNAEVWPDGSKMEKWFSSNPEKLSKQEARRFVITDFGAIPDSTLLQTEAIQKAIDAAAAEGGTVVIPKGVWLSSSLFFKSKTHLCLEKGAVLKGSDRVSDYAVARVHIEGVIQNYVAALVNAYDVDSFSIFGGGVIDGNGLQYWRDFWTRRMVNPKCTNLEALRPRMIYVANGSNILIENVTLRNSGFWTTHLYKCNYVRIKDVTIFAPNKPVPAPSSDAIDLDACNNVHIYGCSISVNDDIIALKGGKGPWADTDPDNGTNSNILVENCHFGKGHPQEFRG